MQSSVAVTFTRAVDSALGGRSVSLLLLAADLPAARVQHDAGGLPVAGTDSSNHRHRPGGDSAGRRLTLLYPHSDTDWEGEGTR